MSRRASAGLLLLAAFGCPLPAADPPVSGTFTGDGKEAKLMYVSAHKDEPFAGKPTIQLVFTEKDHAKDPKPHFKAMFGDYGSALVVTVHPDGTIVGCEVAHQAHKRPGFSSVGKIKTTDFKVADGKISGAIKSDGEVETFKQKWKVDIKFETKAP